MEKATELLNNTPNSYMLRQFENPVNPKTLLILKIDLLTVVSMYMSSSSLNLAQSLPARFWCVNMNVNVCKYQKGVHRIQGIGAGLIPTILDVGILDEVIPISHEAILLISLEESIETAKLLALKEGLLVGISSGAAAIKVAKRPENAGNLIVMSLISLF
ncbi:hypothetical protein FNV43_RR04880 [Rhamnella rubrinervis]|uniref:Tryptophan synthase beta chain-like PALP domain-containing protein n=1 Tax=Rhamnella rubrinervis TaxID=2594499 RepID=A0A8K0MQQ2_9ROSA|nr:hypothetical protein FNV43_RR04880 [Rhamnella rubrinervis]